MNGSTSYTDPAAELLAAVVYKAGGEMRLYPQDVQLGKANPLVRWDTADPPCITLTSGPLPPPHVVPTTKDRVSSDIERMMAAVPLEHIRVPDPDSPTGHRLEPFYPGLAGSKTLYRARAEVTSRRDRKQARRDFEIRAYVFLFGLALGAFGAGMSIFVLAGLG